MAKGDDIQEKLVWLAVTLVQICDRRPDMGGGGTYRIATSAKRHIPSTQLCRGQRRGQRQRFCAHAQSSAERT